jgi:adenylate kinase
MRFSTLLSACALSATLAFGQQLVKGPVVVLLGPPASGKTTQAAAAAKYLKVPVVSVESLIRDNAAAFQKDRTKGLTGMEPETDPMLNRFFEARLQKGDLSSGMLLDGYPNTVDQANFAAKLVRDGVISKPLIVHLLIPDDVVRKRLQGSSADVAASAEQRLKDYHRETDAIKVYFPDAEIVEIDGTKSPDKVRASITAALKRKFGK